MHKVDSRVLDVLNNEDPKILDALNNKRVNVTKLRVAHAIRLLAVSDDAWEEDKEVADASLKDIAHAINLLEAGGQEMKWACEHFDWNDEVCFQIDDACRILGSALAILIDDKDENYDPVIAGCDVKDAAALLGKILATLERWFDDDVNVSEV